MLNEMGFTFNKIQDLTSTKRVEGLSLGGSVRLRYGTAVNDLSKDGAFADNSDNSLVTEKAIKTYVDTAVGVEDLWDRDSTNSYTYLKNTDNVGIGTSTPAQKLVVDGNILQTDGDYLATDQVRAINGDGLKLYDDGSNGIFVEDGGQVGIGTTAPSDLLAVAGASKSIGLSAGNTDSVVKFMSDKVGTVKWEIRNDNDAGLVINEGANGATNANVLVCDNGGNVGIGTASPSVELEVDGDIKCDDINVQYDYIRSALDYNQSAGTFVVLQLDGGTRPKTSFAGSSENCCMIAPHDGTLEFILFRSEEVAGNPVVIGFHKASDGTEVPSDTPTASVSVDMSAVADDTTTKFAFTSSNTFDAGDVLGFSIDPANDINDCLFVIALKYDTTTNV
jgi:hypothetical protein